MSYVDAGYAIALSALFLYSLSLLFRRRRLEAVAARVEASGRAGQEGEAEGAERSPERR